jgi:hypothetical protein
MGYKKRREKALSYVCSSRHDLSILRIQSRPGRSFRSKSTESFRKTDGLRLLDVIVCMSKTSLGFVGVII